jgi:cytochrome c oxidase subunit IV
VDTHDDHQQHVTPQRTYLLAGAALAVLTLVTVGVAFVDLGPLNDVVAVGVASLKAFIIVSIFMHGRQTDSITRLVMVAGILWFAILVVGTLDDYLTRDWLAIPGK